VLGPEAGFKIIEAMPGVAALVEREVSAADGKRNIEVQESQRFHQFESSNK
jgi:hypothetical protein